MSIRSDIDEEKYGDLIDAVEKYTKGHIASLETECKKIEFKLKNLETMFLNVCENVYKLKAHLITVDQLFSIVNGCLDSKVIDRFTWDYLLDSETKEAEIKLQTKQILDNYLKEYDDIDVEEDTDAIELIEDKKSKPRKKRQTKTEITKDAKEQLYKELEEDKKWSEYASDPRNK